MPDDTASSISNDTPAAEEPHPTLKDSDTPQPADLDGNPNRIKDADFLLQIANGDTNGIHPTGEELVVTARKYSTTTQLIHGDDHLNGADDVAPPLHVATTFRYSRNPDLLIPAKHIEVSHPATPATPSPLTTQGPPTQDPTD